MSNYHTISSDNISQLFSVKDKIVLVVGAGGLATPAIHAYAHNGARLAIATRNGKKALAIAEELRSEGFEARGYELDVRQLSNCEAVAQQVEKDFGRLDVLFFSSAVALVADPYYPDPKDLEESMRVNFMGSVWISQAAAKIMKKNGFGRIICVNSTDCESISCIDGLHYAASKAAMASSTRSLAISLAGSGVTVNGIAPTWIWTPMMDQRPADYMRQAKAAIPMGRVSYPEDYFGILFFLSSEASAFATGQTYFVDGGFSINHCFHYEQD